MSNHSPSDHQFLITNPLEQPGVVLSVPPGIRPVMISDGYVSDVEVRCSFCAKRTPHRRGFLAPLPDGSVALLGKDCAVNFSDLETVAAIERDVRRREVLAAANKGIAELAIGLGSVVEILERDWLEDEQLVHQEVRRLTKVFVYTKPPRLAKLSAAAKGLREILKPGSGATLKLTDIKAKRKRALEFIEEGLTELRDEYSKLEHNEVSRLCKNAEPVRGYVRCLLEKRDLYVLDFPSWANPDKYEPSMNLFMTLPKITFGDEGPLHRAIADARSVVN